MESRLAQFSAIELILVIMLFALSSAYFIKPIESTEQDYKVNIDSALDTLYFSDDYTYLFMEENLTVSYHTLDWSTFNSTVNQLYNNFEFVVSDDSNSKIIFSCNNNYSNKYLTERVITIANDSIFEFRKIRLGVCY